MATYAIGDIQGCYRDFCALLEKIAFDPAHDKLWLVGDLVNRGADSLAVLRRVKSLVEAGAATMVLGNHDLHLLMVAAGAVKPHKSDTLQAILAAPDRDELLGWLRQQPLLHVGGNAVMVHAGLLPSWSVARAQVLAREAETVLRGEKFQEFCGAMYGNKPGRWRDDLQGYDRLRVIVNAMTRMRVCTPDGKMEFTHKGKVEDTPAGFMPWFEVPDRKSRATTIICGHWSALDLRVTDNFIALDTGCLWGGSLTSVRLEDRRVFQVVCGLSPK